MHSVRFLASILISLGVLAMATHAQAAPAPKGPVFIPDQSAKLIPELKWDHSKMRITVEAVLPKPAAGMPAPSGAAVPKGVAAPSGVSAPSGVIAPSGAPVQAESAPPLGPVERKVTVMLFGTFKKADYSLVVDAQVMQTAANDSFEFKASYTLPAGKNDIEIPVVSVGPFGETVTAQVWVRLPALAGPRKRHQITPSVGFSVISYDEVYDATEFPDAEGRELNEMLTTLKVSYRFEYTPEWTAGITLYKTLFALSSSLPGITAGFFGINARAGYTFKRPFGPLRLTILTGFYYTTMSVTENPETGKPYFGFANLMGPQIYPSVQRVFPRGDSMQLYLKFSPIGDAIGVLKPEFNEIATGLSYVSAPMRNGHTWSVAVDWARIHAQIEQIATVDNSSISVSGGYSFW